jgi:hypothetical protein
MKVEILFLLLTIKLFSCNQKAEELVENKAEAKQGVLNLAGQVYYYAPELDTITCTAFGQCDCCSGKFLFLNGNDFITMNVCESDNWYCKGHYKTVNQNVVLSYDGLVVHEKYNWEMDTDTSLMAKHYQIHTSKTNASTSLLSRVDCAKNICFKTDDKQPSFATLDTSQRLSDLIKQLEDRGIWQNLALK